MQESSGADRDWSKHSFAAEAVWGSFPLKVEFPILLQRKTMSLRKLTHLALKDYHSPLLKKKV